MNLTHRARYHAAKSRKNLMYVSSSDVIKMTCTFRTVEGHRGIHNFHLFILHLLMSFRIFNMFFCPKSVRIQDNRQLRKFLKDPSYSPLLFLAKTTVNLCIDSKAFLYTSFRSGPCQKYVWAHDLERHFLRVVMAYIWYAYSLGLTLSDDLHIDQHLNWKPPLGVWCIFTSVGHCAPSVVWSNTYSSRYMI